MTALRAFATTLVLIAAIAGGTYYYLYGRDYVFRFTEAQLREALARRLPIHKTYLLVFDVTVDNPRVELIEGSDRVNAGLDIALRIRLNREPTELNGSIDASGGLRYDPDAGQFFLTDPAIERLAMAGIPAEYTDSIAGVLTGALGEYYATHPLYTLNRFDARQAAARLVLKSVVVENRQLVVVLSVGTKRWH